MKHSLVSRVIAWSLTLVAATSPLPALAQETTSDVDVIALAEPQAATRIRWQRLSGNNRYETARQIADTGFTRANSVVIASGENYPDALSANALAGALGSPVLLTTAGGLDADTREKVLALGVTNAVIVGGEAAVGPAVAEELEAYGLKTMRIQGTDRTMTSVAAFKTLRSLDTSADTVIVAAGQSFADSLAIGPWSWSKRVPILLCAADGTLPDAAIEALRADTGIKNVVIVGGEAVVDDYVFQQIGDGYDIRRLGGKTRYETAQLICCFETQNGLGWMEPVVATGTNFPDALAGASLAGTRGQVMILAEHSVDDAIRLFRVLGKNPQRAYVLGGTAALSDPSGMVAITFGLDNVQTAILDAADVVEWSGPGLCAQWVSDVYREADVADVIGDACDLFEWFCTSSNLYDLRPGMMVAVSSHPHTEMGSIYGHVGIYLGDGLVRHLQPEGMETWPLTEWIEHFGYGESPRWGWPY